MSPEALEQRLAPLVERRLLLREGSRYLALAIPLREHTLRPAAVRQFSRIVKKFCAATATGWIVGLTDLAMGTTVPSGNGRSTEDSDTRRRTVRRRVARERVGHRPRIRRLVASQFSVDGRGRLVIKASARRMHSERRR
jgi:hypothetical protein